MKTIELSNYFAGQFQQPPTTGRDSSDVTIEKLNPADHSQILWKYNVCLPHVEHCLNSAVSGYHLWKKKPLIERKKYILNYLSKLSEKKNELAKVLTLENGQNSNENLAEIEICLALAPQILNHIETAIKDTETEFYTSRGPAIHISSFCRPIFFTHRFLITNLLAGNSVIIKPSEKMGHTVETLFSCLHQAEFPAGVINLIHDQATGEVATRLIKDKRVRNISFVGSNETGRILYQQCHDDLDRQFSFELSKKNICILASEFDEEKICIDLPTSAFKLSGQDCFAPSLVFIPKMRAQKTIERIHLESKKISIDHPAQSAFMGPLIDQQAVDNYLLFMGMAKREGFEEIMRGKQIERNPKGYFVTPSIHYCENFKDKSHFLQSSFLGPNLTFIGYESINDVIEMANKIELTSLVSLYGASKIEQNEIKEKLLAEALFIESQTTSAIQKPQIHFQLLEKCYKKIQCYQN